jgi:hypothetical protein
VTTETKTFIALDDIRGMRIECGKCQVSSFVPIDSPQFLNVADFTKCPHCGVWWFVSTSDPRREAVTDFARALARIRAAAEDSEMTFSITLEIPAQGAVT